MREESMSNISVINDWCPSCQGITGQIEEKSIVDISDRMQKIITITHCRDCDFNNTLIEIKEKKDNVVY